MKKQIKITGKEKVKFNNNVDYCVGTGRMGLALTKEYLDQLELVQKEIGFKFIRGMDYSATIWQFIRSLKTVLPSKKSLKILQTTRNILNM